MGKLALSFLAITFMLGGCRTAAPTAEPGPIEATSLRGEPLRRPSLPERRRVLFEAQLSAARTRLGASPEDPVRWIWVGRRLAYLGRYLEAVEVYSEALERSPGEVRLLRHRGHRFLTLRRPELARRDLELAVQHMEGQRDRVEPDGVPNSAGIPRSTTQTNVLYHLGLALRLLGEDRLALGAFEDCLERSPNDDMRVASAYWVVLSHWRLGQSEAARELLSAFYRPLEIFENSDYRLLLGAFRAADPESIELVGLDQNSASFATRAYGKACLLEHLGRRSEASALLERVLAENANWPAFGHLMAEAGLGVPAAEDGSD